MSTLDLTAKKMKSRLCPICGSKDRKLIFRQRFSRISGGTLLDAYEVVCCNKCGFCFADSIPDQGIFDNYYREMSKYEKDIENFKDSSYDLGRFKQTVSFAKPFLGGEETRIVELGCTTGLLLSLIKREGYNNLLGIDPSPACTGTAIKMYGISVETGALSEISLKDQSVDFLILVGVLEHIRDLDGSLTHIRRMMQPGGKVLVVVPDASRYSKGEDAPFQEFSMEHINFFGPISLTNLMRKNGFSRLEIAQDSFEVSYKTITPVILSIYKKDVGADSAAGFEIDAETADDLSTYVDMCLKKEKVLDSKISDMTKTGEPVIIWGTGAQTMMLLASGRLSGLKIEAFVDSNPKFHGKKLQGIEIVPPANLKGRAGTILISTRAFQNEIEIQIRDELNLANRVVKLFEQTGI